MPKTRRLITSSPAEGAKITTWFISSLCIHPLYTDQQLQNAQWRDGLRTCFRSTVLEELCARHGEDIAGITECITDNINFCLENTVPLMNKQCFYNNKSWINSKTKFLLKENNRDFRTENKKWPREPYVLNLLLLYSTGLKLRAHKAIEVCHNYSCGPPEPVNC